MAACAPYGSSPPPLLPCISPAQARDLARAPPPLPLHLAGAGARPSTAPAAPLAVRVEAQGIAFRVVYRAEDASEVPRLEAALLRASGSAVRWGSFRESVTIRLFPDHLSLEEAVDRHGYPW